MRRVAIRELNQHTADVMARVEGGERIEVTRNGKTVAVIEPAATSPLGPLIDAGELRPAVGELPVFDDSDSFAADSAGRAAIIADRYRDDKDCCVGDLSGHVSGDEAGSPGGAQS